ncbi:MAG: long-chain fatty acid--CoA ligase [Mycoplasma sp.]|nr:long-chain fatty acid--CoA ligase [Mycoplasma sp.]
MMLTPNHATLYQGMKDTQVIPNAQTKQILGAVNLANSNVIDTRQLESKLDGVQHAIRESKATMIFDKKGITNYQSGTRAFSQRINNRFRN